MPPSRPPFSLGFDVTFGEALAAAKKRGVVLSDVFYADLQKQARANAFTVSGLVQIDQVQSVLDSLNRALGDGRLFRDWKREQLATLAGLPKDRAETIYRNAVQTAYSIGRTTQQRENKARRPYLMWDAINDGRTRPTHRAMDGHIAPIDDPIWQKWSPPAGHRCRCTRIALTEAQAKARGYPTPTPAVEPDPGWNYEKADDQAGKLAEVAKRKATRTRAKVKAPPDNLPATSFVPQATTKAAAAWAKQQNLADVIDYGKMHVDVANAWNQSLFEHLTEFPALRTNQKYTGTAQGQFRAYEAAQLRSIVQTLRPRYPSLPDADLEAIAKRYVRKKKVPPGTFAHSWAQKDVAGIGVNEAWAKDPVRFNAALERTVQNGFHPPGTGTVKAVVDHELGHQLDDLLQITRSGRHPILDPLYDAFMREGRALAPGTLSVYGMTNRAEFLAEAWAEYRNSPNPRPIAKAVGELIKDAYRAKYPASGRP
jgi:SPP1 gp7 family putative phage head morphogenesis protein